MVEFIKDLAGFTATVSGAILAIAFVLKYTPFAAPRVLYIGAILFGVALFLWLVLAGLSVI